MALLNNFRIFFSCRQLCPLGHCDSIPFIFHIISFAWLHFQAALYFAVPNPTLNNEHSNTLTLSHIHQETVRKCDVYFHTFSEAFSLLYLLMRALNAAMSKVTTFFLWIIRFLLCSLFYSFIALWLIGTYCVNTFSSFYAFTLGNPTKMVEKGFVFQFAFTIFFSTDFFLYFMTFKQPSLYACIILFFSLATTNTIYLKLDLQWWIKD